MTNVFQVNNPTDLSITHTESNFSDRLALFGTRTYHFKGTITGSNSSYMLTDVFSFDINFVDACRTATITY